MTKEKIIGKIRQRGERDLKISGDAWRLLCRICSQRYVDPKARMSESFPLPWSQVAIWCGLSDDKSAARKINELVDSRYLKRDAVRGCPGKMHFFLLPSCPEKGATGCPEKGATSYGSGGATSCPSGGADHISNSLREERLEERGGKNGSLRSAETKGDAKAAPPKLTDAKRSHYVHELSNLKKGLKAH